MTKSARTLPIGAEHREFSVKVNGQQVPRSQQLLSASVSAIANKIASAKLVYQDGAAATGQFQLIEQNLFSIGSRIEIFAGPSAQQQMLFAGLVIGHKIKITEGSAPQLIITCKHQAIKATLSQQGRYFESQRDSDIIEQVLNEHGLNVQVEATTFTHLHMVQSDSSDWQFCLQRACANGLLVLTRGDRLLYSKADLSADPTCHLQFGATLLAADLATDARQQASSHQARFWDPSEQQVVVENGTSQLETTPGNSSPSQLAASMGSPQKVLRQSTERSEESRQWANASQLEAELNRVTGSIKTLGLAQVLPGDCVQLSGLSSAFNGKALVTGVRHEMDTINGWRSHFQIGGISRPAPAAPLPEVAGLMIGIVISNDDPDGEFRVKIRLPILDNDAEGIWARVGALDAGDDRGLMLRPEVGDEVIVGFIQQDPRRAVILGMLHSSAHPAPAQPSDDNHIKLFKSRSGLQIRLDDDLQQIELITTNDKKLLLNDEGDELLLSDEHGNSVKLSGDGMTLTSEGDIKLTASGDIDIQATNISMAASANFKAEGAAGADLTTSAVATVKGSLVKIN
ncbi:hypothetical protein GCM10011369_27140 [Neiella marina]|uniref:Gp5/Type VI secretion system Vgr protein OB-fold domain-containing protein n=1 Tax=Neiella marina TaxID=508461 RepID=A0A8J2XQ81_9GAMM|nr:type VI secretion system tip protein VgrG [Neiella marina]GGA83692.1 hypothetical protein GCM10011369_27140 [Neiella marina]